MIKSLFQALIALFGFSEKLAENKSKKIDLKEEQIKAKSSFWAAWWQHRKEKKVDKWKTKSEKRKRRKKNK